MRADINRRAEIMEATEHQRATSEADAVDISVIKLKCPHKPPKKQKITVFQH